MGRPRKHAGARRDAEPRLALIHGDAGGDVSGIHGLGLQRLGLQRRCGGRPARSEHTAAALRLVSLRLVGPRLLGAHGAAGAGSEQGERHADSDVHGNGPRAVSQPPILTLFARGLPGVWAQPHPRLLKGDRTALTG